MTSQAGDVRLCVLLAYFTGAKRAAKARGAIGKRIRGHGDSILDEIIVTVDPKRRLHLHYPRQAIAGALTAALTWGVFGLITGGVQGLGVWAILGAICGGLFSYYSLSRLSKDQRKGIGQHLPAGSSALAAWIQGSDPRRVLAAAAPSAPRWPAWRPSGPICPARWSRPPTARTAMVQPAAAPGRRTPGGGDAAEHDPGPVRRRACGPPGARGGRPGQGRHSQRRKPKAARPVPPRWSW